MPRAMDTSSSIDRQVARILLAANAVEINSKDLFVYTSGIHSPIYCDLRVLIDSPEFRNQIVDFLVDLITTECNLASITNIAGIATSGVPWAAWVAQKLNKRMSYVRPEPKGHGKGKQVEGNVGTRDLAVVVEDHISTGGSAIAAATALRDQGATVDHCFSIFTYGLEKARKGFEEINVKSNSLCTVETLLTEAVSSNKKSAEDADSVRRWIESQTLGETLTPAVL